MDRSIGKSIVQYVVLRVREKRERKMREWLSGGVSPCQGEGRGFESRLALLIEMREVPKKQGLPDFYILSFHPWCTPLFAKNTTNIERQAEGL